MIKPISSHGPKAKTTPVFTKKKSVSPHVKLSLRMARHLDGLLVPATARDPFLGNLQKSVVYYGRSIDYYLISTDYYGIHIETYVV